MVSVETVTQAVFTAIDEVNEDLPDGQSLEKSRESVLLGANAQIDSVGLVGLIAAIEAQIEDDLDVSIILADERAMSQTRSPFRNVGALIDYATTLVEEQQ